MAPAAPSPAVPPAERLAPNRTALFPILFADELVRAGVQHACVTPGSRSAPLALALAAHPALRLWMHLDERSAAFFALGLAKATRLPVALACTSGTAAANFLPAVVEAFHARVPLVVLTADRPPELQGCGAPQTIDQLRLFGSHVRWFADAGTPEATVEALRFARSLACRAVAAACGSPAGPVHLNLPLREPLAPEVSELPESLASDLAAGGRLRHSWTRVQAARPALDESAVAEVAAALRSARRPLIVCGPLDDPDPALPGAVATLADGLGAPVLAEPGVESPPPGARPRPGRRPRRRAALRAVPRRPPARRRRAARRAADLEDPGHLARPPAGGAAGGRRRRPRLGRSGRRRLRGAARRAVPDRERARRCARAGACRRPLAQPLAAGGRHRTRSARPRPRGGGRAVRRPCGGRARRDARGRHHAVCRQQPRHQGSGLVLARRRAAGPRARQPGRQRHRRLRVEHARCGRRPAGSDGRPVRRPELPARHRRPARGTSPRPAGRLPRARQRRRRHLRASPDRRVPRHLDELFVTPHGLDLGPLVEACGARFLRVEEPAPLAPALDEALHAGGTTVLVLSIDRARSLAAHRRAWAQAAGAVEAHA